VSIQAVFFDLGGVILRTEHQSPRQHLAERLGMEYEDLDRLVFASDSAYKASIGKITEEEHWAEMAKRLRRPPAEAMTIFVPSAKTPASRLRLAEMRTTGWPSASTRAAISADRSSSTPITAVPAASTSRSLIAA